jgi:hypothetical protein
VLIKRENRRGESTLTWATPVLKVILALRTRALDEKVKCLLRIWKGSSGYDGGRVYLFRSHVDHWGFTAVL